HLLLADMVLKEQGFGELLPGADAIVVDEAHQLPELASQYFGHAVSSRQLIGVARDAVSECLQIAEEAPRLHDHAVALERRTADVRIAFGEQRSRFSWRECEDQAGLLPALDNLRETLDDFLAALEPLAERSRGLENCL